MFAKYKKKFILFNKYKKKLNQNITPKENLESQTT